MKKTGTTRDKGTTRQHTPPFNETTVRTRRGTPHTRRGVQQHSRPPSTMPPTIHDGPTLHHDEGGVDGGCPTTRTAQTHTHRPHPTHPAKNSARHDSSTRQHCNGMSRTRATPPHRAEQQQYTPPPFHTPKRVDTIHSSTHPLSLIRVHTTDDQR